MKNSVLIMGLDGVSWGLLKPWIKEEKNLAGNQKPLLSNL